MTAMIGTIQSTTHCQFSHKKSTQQFHEWKEQSTAQSVLNHVHVFHYSLENNAEHCNHGNSFEYTPLVWDTGASVGLTPFRSDL